VPLPTRFLFILLGPCNEHLRYHEVGRSIATLMADEVDIPALKNVIVLIFNYYRFFMMWLIEHETVMIYSQVIRKGGVVQI
jgi:hypothetical protein